MSGGDLGPMMKKITETKLLKLVEGDTRFTVDQTQKSLPIFRINSRNPDQIKNWASKLISTGPSASKQKKIPPPPPLPPPLPPVKRQPEQKKIHVCLPKTSSDGNKDFKLIESVSGLIPLQNMLNLPDVDIVSVDCEWSGVTICLVQLSLINPETNYLMTFILDLVPPVEASSSLEGVPSATLCANQAKALLEPLRESLFQNPTILKIFHDGREDVLRISEILPGIKIGPVADTQILSAIRGLTASVTAASRALQSGRDRPNKEADRISLARVGLGALLDQYQIVHDTKDEVKAMMRTREAVNMWLQRPLPPLLLRYAVSDAKCLLELWLAMTEGESEGVQLSLALSQLQVSMEIEQKIDAADPNVKALAACFQEGGGSLQFEMVFKDEAKGRGISYGIFMDPSRVVEDDSEVQDVSLEPEPEIDEYALDLISLLPDPLATSLLPWTFKGKKSLLEIVIDQGREVTVKAKDRVEGEGLAIASIREVLECLSLRSGKTVAELFGSDNRMALPSSLHRISRMVDQNGHIYGLTLRVGRHIGGFGSIFADLLSEMCDEKGGILLVGAPGLGKTTLLRDMVRILADNLRRYVVVVDTSNEIAGDGNPPHSCIGKARRMMVGNRDHQDAVLRECVQNHTPEVVVVDELGSKKEVETVRIIGEKGVSMLATAHGVNINSLLVNPELVVLLGGIEVVTIGDQAAREDARGGGSKKKTRSERKGEPVFKVLVEVIGQGEWRVHRNVKHSVDSMLEGGQGHAERRRYFDDGRGGRKMVVSYETPLAARMAMSAARAGGSKGLETSYAAVAKMGGEGHLAGTWLFELIQAAGTM